MNNDISKTIPSFGYEILRDHVLSSILGKNEGDILYWAGKELARKFPLFSMEEAAAFFKEAGWGDLELIKEGKDEAVYRMIENTYTVNIENRCFRLEAGFLAEQQQKQIGYLTECYDEAHPKQNYVTFKLKWDLKDPMK